MRLAWRNDTPPSGKVVEVWFMTAAILAVYDGSTWRTADGQHLIGVTHWRFRQ
jgi:hypothetical protein